MPVGLTKREQSILRVVVSVLYLHKRGDKENHNALCSILHTLLGPNAPDLSNDKQMHDLYLLLHEVLEARKMYSAILISPK